MVIYVDILIIINFTVGYFLLITSAILSGYTYNRKRIIASAAAGALFCLYIFADIKNKIINLFIKVLSLVICSVIAFGVKNKKKLLIQTFYYLILNAVLTGTVIAVSLKSTAVYQNNMFYYIDINPVTLVLLSAIIYLLLQSAEAIKERVSPQKNYNMDIFFKDYCLKQLSAFYDSGFKIKDIVSNKDVIILSVEKIKDKLPRKISEDIKRFLMENYNEVECMFVPVMFTTLSGNGMLPALKAEYILVGNTRIENIIVAFTDNSLGENTDVIFGTDIKRQL